MKTGHSFQLAALSALLVTVALHAHAGVCDHRGLLEALQTLGTVRHLHNCRVETTMDRAEIEGTIQNVGLLYIEDLRLGTRLTLDLWDTNTCEFRYDRYTETFYYHDDRREEGRFLRRFIKFSRGRDGQIKKLEAGVQDPETWTWKSRAICQRSHYGDES